MKNLWKMNFMPKLKDLKKIIQISTEPIWKEDI
jgi:hypothetical protein